MRYRHKDVEAFQWDGTRQMIEDKIGKNMIITMDDRSCILQGGLTVKIGDYIVTTSSTATTVWEKREFEERYEPAEEQVELRELHGPDPKSPVKVLTPAKTVTKGGRK